MSINKPSIGSMSYLDRLRLGGGSDSLKATFHTLASQNSEKAVSLLNDKNLSFPTLYILQPEISKFGLYSYLSLRNQYSLELMKGILDRNTSEVRLMSRDYRQMTYPVLKWMLETGFRDDGLNDQYDEVLEMTAVLLIKTYNDKNCLNIITDMIFNRYRKGFFSYELIWALFESRNPQSLLMAANRLCSTHWKDIELARKLLGFIPCVSSDRSTDNYTQYLCALNWIKENYLFLNYTGEGFQQTFNPSPYALSLDAKYLCKPVSGEGERSMRSLADDESILLEEFKGLDKDTKELLSSYSYRLYRQNIQQWNMWIHYPLAEKIKTAKSAIGGLA